MAASLREQILARMALVLTGATPAGANVFRAREVSITRDVSPAISVLYRGTPEAEPAGAGSTKHRMTVDLAIFVRGDPWDSLADAVDTAAHAVLMADPVLQSLGAQLVRHGDDADAQEADRTAGALIVHYAATFFTRAGDITQRP